MCALCAVYHIQIQQHSTQQSVQQWNYHSLRCFFLSFFFVLFLLMSVSIYTFRVKITLRNSITNTFNIVIESRARSRIRTSFESYPLITISLEVSYRFFFVSFYFLLILPCAVTAGDALLSNFMHVKHSANIGRESKAYSIFTMATHAAISYQFQ